MLDITMDGEVQKHRKQRVANAAADQTVSMARYRDLAERFNYFIKQHDKRKEELSHYRARCYELEGELRAINPELYQAFRKIDRQQQRLKKLEAENIALRKELAGIKEKLHQQPKVLPTFVKANVSKDKPRLRPGRKAGHPAALRPMPENIDEHIDVPVPRDTTGAACCPHCSVQLADVEQHDRIVEDIIPAKVVARCYHTISGYCPGCRKRVESRAPEQPPAVAKVLRRNNCPRRVVHVSMIEHLSASICSCSPRPCYIFGSEVPPWRPPAESFAVVREDQSLDSTN